MNQVHKRRVCHTLMASSISNLAHFVCFVWLYLQESKIEWGRALSHQTFIQLNQGRIHEHKDWILRFSRALFFWVFYDRWAWKCIPKLPSGIGTGWKCRVDPVFKGSFEKTSKLWSGIACRESWISCRTWFPQKPQHFQFCQDKTYNPHKWPAKYSRQS